MNEEENLKSEEHTKAKAGPKKKGLVTLQNFNAERIKLYAEAALSKPNGIECPKCGNELMDVNPNDVFGTDPPTMEVACSTCDYRGKRVA